MALILPEQFPTADRPNRTDQTPAGGPWSGVGAWGTVNGMRVVGNELAILSTGSWQDDLLTASFDRSVAPVVSGFEVSAPATVPIFFLWLAVPGSEGNPSGYSFRYEAGSLALRVYTGGDYDDVGATLSVALTGGSAIAMSVEPTGEVVAWTRLSGVWTGTLIAVDTTHMGALKPGWETTATGIRIPWFYGGYAKPLRVGSGLYDNFNRSNVGPPPGPKWVTGQIFPGLSGMAVVSNTLRPTASGWNETGTADVVARGSSPAISADVASTTGLTELRLLLTAGVMGWGEPEGYELRVTATAWEWYEVVGSTFTYMDGGLFAQAQAQAWRLFTTPTTVGVAVKRSGTWFVLSEMEAVAHRGDLRGGVLVNGTTSSALDNVYFGPAVALPDMYDVGVGPNEGPPATGWAGTHIWSGEGGFIRTANILRAQSSTWSLLVSTAPVAPSAPAGFLTRVPAKAAGGEFSVWLISDPTQDAPSGYMASISGTTVAIRRFDAGTDTYLTSTATLTLNAGEYFGLIVEDGAVRAVHSVDGVTLTNVVSSGDWVGTPFTGPFYAVIETDQAGYTFDRVRAGSILHPVSEFVGPDEDPLSEGGVWQKWWPADDALERVGNTASAKVAGTGYASSSTLAEYPADIVAVATVARRPTHSTANAMVVGARIKNAGLATHSGYMGAAFTGASQDNWRIYRVTGGSPTLLVSGNATRLLVGDRIALALRGSTIELWHWERVSGNWNLRQTTTDAAYSAAGAVGLEAKGNVATPGAFENIRITELADSTPSPPAQSANAAGFRTQPTFGTATVKAVRTVTVSGFRVQPTYGTATALPGSATRSLTGFRVQPTYGTATVLPGGVSRTLTGFQVQPTFGTPTTGGAITVNVTGFQAQPTFGTVTATTGTVATPNGFRIQPQYGTPTVATGPTTVPVSGSYIAATFGVPQIPLTAPVPGFRVQPTFGVVTHDSVSSVDILGALIPLRFGSPRGLSPVINPPVVPVYPRPVDASGGARLELTDGYSTALVVTARRGIVGDLVRVRVSFAASPVPGKAALDVFYGQRHVERFVGATNREILDDYRSRGSQVILLTMPASAVERQVIETSAVALSRRSAYFGAR